MNVLVTAGGTNEKIDNVRSISNISTGKLGSLVADCFSANPMIENIFYVCSKTAVKPQSNKAKVLIIDNVSSLESTVKEIINHTDIDIIVHSMAVSDYRVKSVTSAATFADSIISNLDMIMNSDNPAAGSALVSLLKKSESVINGDGKIPSNVDDMLLLMERTPKIISLFQTLSPKSTLVGFKLLDNVSFETLINKGFQILIQNKCSFVLANDLKDISDEQHIGYLIDKNKNYTRYLNKMDIANAIISATINEREKKS